MNESILSYRTWGYAITEIKRYRKYEKERVRDQRDITCHPTPSNFFSRYRRGHASAHGTCRELYEIRFRRDYVAILDNCTIMGTLGRRLFVSDK